MRAPTRIGVILVAVLAAPAAAHPGLHHDIAGASEAIDREPLRAELYVARAYLERLDEEYDSALADVGRALELDPANLPAFAERGMTLSALGRDAEADAALTRFVQAGGTGPTFAERAKVRERQGRKNEAIADYTSAIALRPDVEFYLTRGAIQESIHDLAAAATGYRDGREKLGHAVTLDLALIRVETARKRYSAALAVIDEQLASAAVKTDWYLRRAEVLTAAGRSNEARVARATALEQANLAVAQNASGIHLFSRAKVQAALGRVEDAKHDLELVLEKSPRFAEARELLAALDTPNNDKGMKP